MASPFPTALTSTPVELAELLVAELELITARLVRVLDDGALLLLLTLELRRVDPIKREGKDRVSEVIT